MAYVDEHGSFEHYCMCGGYAWSMNGRPESQPHMDWCPQFAEYAAWWKAKQEPVRPHVDR